jgi:hypothetical protein
MQHFPRCRTMAESAAEFLPVAQFAHEGGRR